MKEQLYRKIENLEEGVLLNYIAIYITKWTPQMFHPDVGFVEVDSDDVCTPTYASAEELALTFHNTYEALAPKFGYETRTETRKFDKNSANGKLMIAVCKHILDLGFVE